MAGSVNSDGCPLPRSRQVRDPVRSSCKNNGPRKLLRRDCGHTAIVSVVRMTPAKASRCKFVVLEVHESCQHAFSMGLRKKHTDLAFPDPIHVQNFWKVRAGSRSPERGTPVDSQSVVVSTITG